MYVQLVANRQTEFVNLHLTCTGHTSIPYQLSQSGRSSLVLRCSVLVMSDEDAQVRFVDMQQHARVTRDSLPLSIVNTPGVRQSSSDRDCCVRLCV